MFKSAIAQVITSLPDVTGAPEPTSPASLVAYIFYFAFSIVGIAVFIAFLIGAIRYFFSAGNPAVVSDAKDRMLHAFLGLAVFLFSVIFLYTLNPDFLKLRNPGSGGLGSPSQGPAGAPGDSCRFISAQWAGTAVPGAEVGLVVVTEDCDDGIPVAFRIVETGMALSGTVLGNEASSTWIIPLASTETSYFFEATSGEEKIISDALEVGQNAGAPGPFSEACLNTAKGDALPSSCVLPCAGTVTSPNFTYTCDEAIERAASKFGIPRALIVAIMRKECPGGNLDCTTPDGGCGLMGVNPQILFDPASEFKACQYLFGSGASDITQACPIMVSNPDIAIAVGACILEIDMRSAERFKSENNYPPGEIQYTAAAYYGGVGVNAPSCSCRNSGSDALPAGCTQSTSTICGNCSTTIPRWMCPFDSSSLGACQANTSYTETRKYAATIDSYFAFYTSDCPPPSSTVLPTPAPTLTPAPTTTPTPTPTPTPVVCSQTLLSKTIAVGCTTTTLCSGCGTASCTQAPGSLLCRATGNCNTGMVDVAQAAGVTYDQVQNISLNSWTTDDNGQVGYSDGSGYTAVGQWWNCTCACSKESGSQCGTTQGSSGPLGRHPYVFAYNKNECNANGCNIWGAVNSSWAVRYITCNTGCHAAVGSCVPD
ncbi:MAG: hypothetical protein Q7S09_05715 [bacterium]|nr:hypothetical protein [bacterium]